MYFSTLNYTLANEDTSLELELLESGQKVLSIAGSGARVLPLFAKNPSYVACCDCSPIQLELTRLRIEAAKSLDYKSFLELMGYLSIYGNRRREIFKELNIDLPLLTQFFDESGWKAPLYQGRWERAMGKMRSFIKFLGKHRSQIFSYDNKQEFDSYYKRSFPKWRWRLVLWLCSSSFLFNVLLYKGSYPRKNIGISYFEYYRKMFDSLFRGFLPQKNFFLHFLFLGNVGVDSRPIEASEELFYKIKAGIKNCQIEYFHGDLFKVLEQTQNTFDFVSLSDIASYFPVELGESFLERLVPHLKAYAKVVCRYYLHRPAPVWKNNFNIITERYNNLIEQEQTQIYSFDIFERKLDV